MARLTETELATLAPILGVPADKVRDKLMHYWRTGQKDRAMSLAETARTLALADRAIAEAAPLMTHAEQ